jgi:hypothetical protein
MDVTGAQRPAAEAILEEILACHGFSVDEIATRVTERVRTIEPSKAKELTATVVESLCELGALKDADD